MGEKATFHIADDWVALLELKPAARTVYSLLRCNAAYGRSGVATHSVHVTSSWFHEMTQHWENPLTMPTVRRGLNELIDKGVLIRTNDPQDGSGFVLAFVTDPGPQYQGPVNGFQHAKRVSKRCGTKAYYVRQEETLGIPSVTGIRRNAQGPGAIPRQAPAADSGVAAETPAEPFDGTVVESGTPKPEPAAPQSEVTPAMREFAERLEERTGAMTDPKLRLMAGACQRLAEAVRPALDQGWDPKVLANRLASELNPRINTPERFLASKAKDLGSPPKAAHFGAPSADVATLDGVREAEVRRAPEPEVRPGVGDEAEMAMIVEAYQERKRRRTIGGPGFPKR